MRRFFVNANVITVDDENPNANAFIVDGGKFFSVGIREDIEHLSEGAEIIDLRGKTVLPGFNDSHIHLLNYAYSMTKIDLEKLDSIESIIESSREYIKKRNIANGEWILGRGWNNNFVREKRYMTHSDLDRISTDHPILFTRICEHSVVVNSMAMEIIGIRDDTPDPPGGYIERDSNGKATGLLRENARYMAYSMQSDKSVDEIKKMLKEAIKVISSYGITSVQSDDFETFSSKDYEKVIKAYEELRDDGELDVRVYEQCLLPEISRLKGFLSRGYHTGYGDDMFKIGPLKLLTDGSIGQRTALLTEPYSDDISTAGIGVFSQDELDELITTAHTGKMQILCHAIGDGAMNMTLSSFEKALKIKPADDHRMGIVHVQITTKEILEKMKQLKVLAYAEPISIGVDLHYVEDRVGSDRIRDSYNYKTMLDMGIRMPLSSDCPVDSVNPMDSAYVAVNRTDLKGYPEGGWYKEQALSIREVIKGFTIESAYASFDENRKGSIKKDKYADFIIISDEITSINSKQLKDVLVLETYLGGKSVFKRN